MRDVTIVLYEFVKGNTWSPWYPLSWDTFTPYSIVTDEYMLRYMFDNSQKGVLRSFVFDNKFLRNGWLGLTTPEKLSSIYSSLEKFSNVKGNLIIVFAGSKRHLKWLVENHTYEFASILDLVFPDDNPLVVDKRKEKVLLSDSEPYYLIKLEEDEDNFVFKAREILHIERDLPEPNELAGIKLFEIKKRKRKK